MSLCPSASPFRNADFLSAGDAPETLGSRGRRLLARFVELDRRLAGILPPPSITAIRRDDAAARPMPARRDAGDGDVNTLLL